MSESDVEVLRAQLRSARKELGKVCDRLHHTRIELALYKERHDFSAYRRREDDAYGHRMLFYSRELMAAVDPDGYNQDGPYREDHGRTLVKIRKLRAVALAHEPNLLRDELDQVQAEA